MMHLSSTWRGVLLHALWLLYTAACPAFSMEPAAAGPLWDSGLKALERSDYQVAVSDFTEWIANGAKAGVRSPEAHYNLALSHWNLKQNGPAIYHLLKSATLSSSPIKAWERLDSLGSLQKEIGIHDGVPEKLFFQLFLLGNRDVAIFIFALGFWSLFGLIFWRWIRGIPMGPYMKGLFAIPFLLWTAGAILFINHEYLFRFGVLDTVNEGIPLFKSAGEPSEKKLVDLPPGTIVTWGQTSSGFVQISYPVVGWVPESDLRRLD